MLPASPRESACCKIPAQSCGILKKFSVKCNVDFLESGFIQELVRILSDGLGFLPFLLGIKPLLLQVLIKVPVLRHAVLLLRGRRRRLRRMPGLDPGNFVSWNATCFKAKATASRLTNS